MMKVEMLAGKIDCNSNGGSNYPRSFQFMMELLYVASVLEHIFESLRRTVSLTFLSTILQFRA
jgi:hypothetical protein